MILKEITSKNAISPTAKAGQEQETNVAFFLRRAFKDHSSIFVINDYKFTYNFETAQIDHLIVYPYGFILIESKSITGEVKVNSFSEWSRSFNNKWSGMPSPIKQVELQQKLLLELLYENREKILGKLLGIKQQSFGFRCWNNICVVSSNAIIDRESMPNDVSQQLVKSEFLVDKLNKIMNLKSVIGRFLTLTDSRPKFSDAEMESITEFIMSQCHTKSEVTDNTTLMIDKLVENTVEPIIKIYSRLKCKKCGEPSDYEALHGRYGYFIKCNKCTTNTAMKIPCANCQSVNAKVSKSGNAFFLNCGDCESSEQLL